MNQVFWGGGFVFLAIRKIFAPGEEENLELEEEEDATAGAGSTEAFPPRAPGALHLFITRLSSHVIVTCCRVLEDHLTVCVCFFFLSFLLVPCMASPLIPACFISSFARYSL